jgi:hypothetical protein
LANPKLPTLKALKNNAAKDDIVGHDGDFNFTIDDLLSNDPGGANKDGSHFFFGVANANGTIPTMQEQIDYLLGHGIHANVTDGKFVSFDVTTTATDFDYCVQIGNNGTWSQAHVTVEDTPDAPPVDTHHNGDLMAEWTFENHTVAAGDDTGTPTGFWNLNNWAASHPNTYGQDADNFGFTDNIQVHGADGHRALDTAGSPGNIFLQAIPEGRGGADATMPDLVEGKTYHAEVSILKQDYTHVAGMIEAGTEGTDPDAWVAFKFNDTVMEVHASDVRFTGHNNEFLTFDATFQGIAGEDAFTIMSHGTHDDNQGLLVDHIQIHDWVV